MLFLVSRNALVYLNPHSRIPALTTTIKRKHRHRGKGSEISSNLKGHYPRPPSDEFQTRCCRCCTGTDSCSPASVSCSMVNDLKEPETYLSNPDSPSFGKPRILAT